MTDAIETLEADLSRVKAPHVKIDILNTLAWELRDLDSDRGLEYAQTAYRLAQTEQYQKGIADSLIAQSQYIFNNYVQVLSQGVHALSIYEDIGDLAGQSRALYTVSWAHWSFDNFVEAMEAGQRAHTIAQEIGDPTLQADTLNNLGLIHKRSGNFELGYTFYHQALEKTREIGDKIRQRKVLTNIALANAAEAKYDRALTHTLESLQLGVISPLFTGYTLLVLGQAYIGVKNFDEASFYLEQAIIFARDHENEQLLLTAMVSMGEMLQKQGEPEQAIAQLQEALEIAAVMKTSLDAFRCHEILSQVYEAQGNLELALLHYKEFHAGKEKLFNDKNINRLQGLEIQHRSEIARREAEIYQLRNVALEKEITEHKRLEDLLQQQATTDMLTGISNRRHFIELVEYEIKRVYRDNQPLTLAMIDIDNFKKINDQFGHASGDVALVAFTKTIKQYIRDIDIFARYGGDEFVLLFPQTSCDQALPIVDRIRNALAVQKIVLGDMLVEMTISAGISGFAHSQDTLAKLLERTDKALYQAKMGGRNRIRIEPAPD